MAIIESHDITKTFSKSRFNWRTFRREKEEKIAVNNLNIDIEEGEFVGFLGPNGAGKTTFLKIVSGVIHPTSGEAKVMGFTPWERDFAYLRQIALVMGQKNQLWWDLPAEDSFQLMKAVYEIDDKRYRKNLTLIVDTLGMSKLLKQRLRDMSLGERMKCELAACFLHDPKVIFLDEPTIGLDVISAQSIRDFLKTINAEKKCTIILTSHYMADIEALCKRVIVINHGQKVYDGSLVDLKNKYIQTKEIEIYLPTIEDKSSFARLKVDKSILDGVGHISVGKEKFSGIVKEVFEKFDVDKVSINDPSMEDIISQVFKEKISK